MSTVPMNLDTDAVALPPPEKSGQGDLGSAFEQRHSTRVFLPDPLPLQELSTLLWAGFGINRPDTGGRTAPSAHDWQEIDVYVADFARMKDASDEDLAFLAGADAGCIAQNVYLHCATAGLATVVRGLIDRRQLARVLGLKPTQRIALGQSVGYAGPAA